MMPKNFAPGGEDLGRVYQSFRNDNYTVDFMFVQGVHIKRANNETN